MPDKGDVIGGWILVFRLGKGGNGDVWSVKSAEAENTVAAMKILHKSNKAAIIRFRDEVEVLRAHPDVKGLLPVLESHLPDNPAEGSPAWYLMPRAKPLTGRLRRDLNKIICAVSYIAKTLATLHGHGISHRDVKPENLLYWEGTPRVSDFGLADFPEKAEVTGEGEELGPRRTIAPEMKRSPKTADGRLADVYSLAKTLWILLANDPKCFDGRYSSDDVAIALRNYLPTAKLLHRLDDLLSRATANRPDDRPTMEQFALALDDWLKKETEFENVSLGDWQHVQRKVFPHGIPTRATWEDKKTIIAMLNLLGATAIYNHTFAPDGGGLDIVGASESFEPDCIELRFENNYTLVLKPKVLMFESFPDHDDWAYFRLETDPLEPIFKPTNPYHEEMVELSPRTYIERCWWDLGYHEIDSQQVPFPSTARTLIRYLRGSFLIVAKASVYNKTAAYDGQHDRRSADQFRVLMVDALTRHNERRPGEREL